MADSRTDQIGIPKVGTIRIDPQGRIVSFDQTAARILDASGLDLRGTSIFQLAGRKSAKPCREALDPESRDHIRSKGGAGLHHIIGSHPLMHHLYQLITLVAQTDVTVHICGESGVGKELVADAIHHFSTRSASRFVKLNCSTIPSTLLESSLFGHVRGAFTDAHRDQQGFIEYAQGGTIFLDEIGELSPDLQVKLLRLLQSHEYCRIGETITRHADVRVITATNRDLKELVEHGKVRDDFYYRINVFPLGVPPLRNRKSDIEELAKFFIAKCNGKFSRSVEGLSAEALALLHAYDWPGNVRELENAVEHAFVMTHKGLILPEHLPQCIVTYHPQAGTLQARIETQRLGTPLRRGMSAEQERSAILAALKQTSGNKAHAASLLGVSRVTLWKKLKSWGDAAEEFKDMSVGEAILPSDCRK